MMGRVELHHMFGPKKGLSDKFAGMFVSQAVEHARALLACANYFAPAQLCEVLGHCCWWLAYLGSEVTYGQLAVTQREDDSDASWVREQGEDVRCNVNVLRVDGLIL